MSQKLTFKFWIATLSASIVLTAALVAAIHVSAQIGDQYESEATAVTAPYSEFQYATLTGTTNTLNVTMLPVVLANGSIAYRNLTIPITVTQDSTGKILTFTADTITAVTTPITNAAAFKAGNYASPSTILGGKGLIAVSSPGVVSGGTTEWSLSASAGANNCTYPDSATWFVAAPNAANNPLASRLKLAGITSTAYSYGTLGASPCSPSDGAWFANTLIGVSQQGSNIVFVSFTDYHGIDHNTAQDTITYAPAPTK